MELKTLQLAQCVGTPERAYPCFMRTDMDYVHVVNFLVEMKNLKPVDKAVNRLKHLSWNEKAIRPGSPRNRRSARRTSFPSSPVRSV